MMGPLKQTDRLFYIDTPLGTDKVLVRSMTGAESISKLFSYELDLVSEDFNINFDQIVGKPITLGIKLADDVTLRYFNGYVSKFTQQTQRGRLAEYRANVVPWLWFLTLTSDCFIHQDKTVPEVIQDVFKKFGFQDYDISGLQRKYMPWVYCVQYRESAFDFVTRLMEEEGIFYFFKQEKTRHTLMLADSPAAHKPCPDKSKFKYEHDFGPGVKRSEDSISGWKIDQQMRTGIYSHKEYNFEKSKVRLFSSLPSRINQGGNGKYETYDYPGEYEEQPEGDTWVRLRIEEEEAQHTIITGEGNCRSLAAGFRFDLTEHDRRDQNSAYVVTDIKHSAQEGGFYSGVGSTEPNYDNTFTAIPYSINFRPPRTTGKAQMLGCQTATVVGPKGEEIYTDIYGRVKVKFHWDRTPNQDENCSCWIRVSQPWAGKNWGGIWLPRIGQEVIVDFIEVDPDRPIIIGRVYNDDQKPPYVLPKNQTQSGFKSRSSKGGGPDNYNELKFEDKKGEELFYLQAEKDMEILVKNDTRETVIRDRSLEVQRNQIEQVDGNKHGTVQGEQRESVQQKVSRQVGGDENVTVSGNYALQAGGEIHLKAGTRIVLEAQAGISFIGPSGFIDVTPAGVVIQGPMVYINSGNPQPPGGLGSNPQAPNAPTNMGGQAGAVGEAGSDTSQTTSPGAGQGMGQDTGQDDGTDQDQGEAPDEFEQEDDTGA